MTYMIFFWHTGRNKLPYVDVRVILQPHSLHVPTDYQLISSSDWFLLYLLHFHSTIITCAIICQFAAHLTAAEVINTQESGLFLYLDQNSSSAFRQRDCLSRVRRARTSANDSSPWTLLSLVRTLTLLVIFSFSPTTAKTPEDTTAWHGPTHGAKSHTTHTNTNTNRLTAPLSNRTIAGFSCCGPVTFFTFLFWKLWMFTVEKTLQCFWCHNKVNLIK